MKKAAILILIILSFWSCNSDLFSGKLKEGVINYKVEYLDDENEKPIISMLPTEMTIKFKKGYSIQEVEGWMGVFRMAGIRHIKDESKTALLKILADKYLYSVKGGQDAFGFDPMKDKKIEYSTETKIIAGYNCKKATVTWDTLKFDVFYTEEIKIQDPNWNNPFGEIDGVMLQYQVDMFGIKTKITAESVENIDIDDEAFDIPDDYKNVSKKEIEDVINNLM